MAEVSEARKQRIRELNANAQVRKEGLDPDSTAGLARMQEILNANGGQRRDDAPTQGGAEESESSNIFQERIKRIEEELKKAGA